MSILKKTEICFLVDLLITVCFLPALLTAQTPAHSPPLTIDSIEQVIIIDRLIAEKAYENIRAGLPADQGMDFAFLEKVMERYRAELEKVDPAYYGVLRETYELMKAYVTDPDSDFVMAVLNPGSVEFKGRSPLPAAAFEMK
ncbi:MAG: hypothetical protein AVO38_04415 [delta proteobacterium ML8_D]|nr:MAG: hypothetical protein AVO38_04415 [delta proteobacterium ML8_D]